MSDISPTARSLLALELISASPGIAAERLAERLQVSARAVRRYVGILREAGLPIESTRGPYGGYRVGRGVRPAPLMFTTTEALGLVMAVLEARPAAADATDPVATALDKLIRVLPEPVARPADAVRRVRAHRWAVDESPDPELTAELVAACASSRRVRLAYRMPTARAPSPVEPPTPLVEPHSLVEPVETHSLVEPVETHPPVEPVETHSLVEPVETHSPRPDRVMEVDPWAVVVRHGRWYLLCWSHTKDARRVLRVDRVASLEMLDRTFAPPIGLDPLRTVEEHLSQGWRYQVEVEVDLPLTGVEHWLPRSLGRWEDLGQGRTRITATTDEPDWYAQQLAALPAAYRVIGGPELRAATRALGERLVAATS